MRSLPDIPEGQGGGSKEPPLVGQHHQADAKGSAVRERSRGESVSRCGFFMGFKSGHVKPSDGRFVSRLYGVYAWRWFFGLSIMERADGEDFLGRKASGKEGGARND